MNKCSVFSTLKRQLLKDDNLHRRALFNSYISKKPIIRIAYGVLAKNKFIKNYTALLFSYLCYTDIQISKPTCLFSNRNEHEAYQRYHLTKNLYKERVSPNLMSICFQLLSLIKLFLFQRKLISKLKRISFLLNKKDLFCQIRVLLAIQFYLHLKNSSPQSDVYISSDGNPYTNALMEVYFVNQCFKLTFLSHSMHQHNPASIKVSRAILWGKHSQEQFILSKSQIKEVEFLKFDIQPFREKSAPNKVLILLSKNFSKKNLSILIQELQKQKYVVSIRPHRSSFFEVNFKGVSITQNTSIGSDLANADLSIGANTNAHLDSLLEGIPSLYYKKLDENSESISVLDFIRNNFIFKIENIEDIDHSMIKNHYQSASFQEKLRSYFNAS